MLLFSLYCCVAINSVDDVVYVWRLWVVFYFDVWFGLRLVVVLIVCVGVLLLRGWV